MDNRTVRPNAPQPQQQDGKNPSYRLTERLQKDALSSVSALEETNEATRALGALIVAAMNEGESFKPHAYGIQSLFQMIDEDYRFNTDELRKTLFREAHIVPEVAP